VSEQSDTTDTRRGFLGKATGALAACTGAAALGPVLVAVISPAKGGIVRLGDGTLDLGPLEQFEDGVPRKVVVKGARTDAYMKFGERPLGSVVVVRRGDKVAVFSATCPHLGCDVAPREKDLFCACHDSAFSLEGAVQSGPSPRALDALESQVEAGHLRVKFERFQPGTPEKRPV
jgi:Rieske Fe-S protein